MTDEDMQIEANAFAMELLMPAEWIMRDAVGLDLADDAGVERLAKRYRVPTATMAVRIGEVRARMAAQAVHTPADSASSRDDLPPPQGSRT